MLLMQPKFSSFITFLLCQQFIYMRPPVYTIIPFPKVLRDPNFAQVKILTVIYVRVYLCVFVHVCGLYKKKEILKM